MVIVYTKHAELMLKERRISKEEVEDAIRYPEKTRKIYGIYYSVKKLQIGKIEVVYERRESYIKIITVYWL